MKIKKNYAVSKQNILNEARAVMSLQELRFFTIYLAKIDPKDPKTRLVRFPLSEFGRIMDLKRIDIRTIKPAVDTLLQKIVHVPLPSGGFHAFQIYKECKVDQSTDGEWFVEINAHDNALPILFEHKSNFFTYKLWNTLRLKSANHIRMYELLKQRANLGHRTETLAALKSLLWIEPKEYPRWQDFKHRIIDGCQQALTDYTDIKFTYEPIRKGRKIVAVKFLISNNADYKDTLSLDEFINQQDEPVIIDVDESSINNTPNTPCAPTQKKNPSERKKAIDKAKEHEFWYFADLITQKSSNVKYPIQYTRSIVEHWQEIGYKTVQDLLEHGEICEQDVEQKRKGDYFKQSYFLS